MIKALIVEKNKIKKIIVTHNLDSVNLAPGESIQPFKGGKRPGEKYKTLKEWFRGLFGK
jgi:hypothetical protein